MAQQTYKILCVDDNPQNLELLDGVLFDQGYIVYIAKNGKQAIEIAKEKLPDLILLDIAMPGMDGFAVLQELKSIPETSDILVIFITALNEMDDRVRGLSLGAVDYITKPFNVNELVPRISNHLQLKVKNNILEDDKKSAVNIMKNQTKLYTTTLEELIMKLKVNEKTLDSILSSSNDEMLKNELDKLKTNNNFVYNRLEKLELRSKIINNSITPNMQQFDLDLVIKEIVGIYSSQAKKKSVTMIYETPGNHMIYADKRLIEVALRNLVSNAVKFTPMGGDIIIDVAEYDMDSKYRVVTVYDTGAGLTNTQQETIFSDSNLSNDDNAQKGLGLSIAYHFVKLCGGKIWVESMPGIGSDFKFTVLKFKP